VFTRLHARPHVRIPARTPARRRTQTRDPSSRHTARPTPYPHHTHSHPDAPHTQTHLHTPHIHTERGREGRTSMDYGAAGYPSPISGSRGKRWWDFTAGGMGKNRYQRTTCIKICCMDSTNSTNSPQIFLNLLLGGQEYVGLPAGELQCSVDQADTGGCQQGTIFLKRKVKVSFSKTSKFRSRN
jgi:hypothetical protein